MHRSRCTSRPAIGACPVRAGTDPDATFTGPLTLVPDRGPDASLVAQPTGTFDTSSGHFAARSTSLSGTGALRRVAGTLQVDGLESLTDGPAQ